MAKSGLKFGNKSGTGYTQSPFSLHKGTTAHTSAVKQWETYYEDQPEKQIQETVPGLTDDEIAKENKRLALEATNRKLKDAARIEAEKNKEASKTPGEKYTEDRYDLEYEGQSFRSQRDLDIYKQEQEQSKKTAEEEARKNQPKHKGQIKKEEKLKKITARRKRKGKEGLTTRQIELQRRIDQTPEDFAKERTAKRKRGWSAAANILTNIGRAYNKKSLVQPRKFSFDTDNPKNKLNKIPETQLGQININKNKVGDHQPTVPAVGGRGVGQMGTTYADWDAEFGHQWEGMSKKKKKGVYEQWLESNLVSGQRNNPYE